MHLRRLCLAACFVLLAAVSAHAAGRTHRLALQISDDSAEKMEAVLSVAANVSRHYSEIGDEVEIRIVAFNGGLNMLRTDRSPVLGRIKSVSESLPNVSFEGCGNTRDSMARKEGKKPEDIPLFPGTTIVQAGAVSLIELSEKGWTILRP